ncbi:MAG TPA: hypothetical protein ACFYEM_09740 [Candidatus Hypogeohydataceae bacterium YC40]
MKGSKINLIIVLVIGVFLLGFFGTMLPLLIGKTVEFYKEYEPLAELYSKKEATLDKNSVPEVIFSVKERTYPQRQYQPKQEGGRTAETSLPILPEKATKGLKQQEGDEALKNALKPSPPPPQDKKENKLAVSKTENAQKDTTSPAEKTLQDEKEAEELLPEIPEVAYVIPPINKTPSNKETAKAVINQGALFVMLPKTIDLKKSSKGPFPVEIKLSQQDNKKLKPQISYWVGTSNPSDYFDMRPREEDIWVFHIPDLGWAKHRSKVLFYQIRILNSEGNVIQEGQIEKELIDSFDDNEFNK